MATSNSYNYTIDRSDVIAEAYEIGGIYSGETLSSDDTVIASRKLNLMIKAWAAQGAHMWAVQEATLFLVKGTASYLLGPTGTHCTASYVRTTLSAAAALGATTISLTATTGMTAADNIGIVLDDGTIHWTTITTVATTLIASGLASAAASGNVVFTYTSKIQRPNRIIPDTIYRRDVNDSDVQIELVGRAEYAQLSDKTTQGKTNKLWYNPLTTNGAASLWLTPDLATDVVRFSFERNVQDFDVGADEPDFPIEWGEALVYGLAARLVVGLFPERFNVIQALAEQKLSIALGFDSENVSVFFAPDSR